MLIVWPLALVRSFFRPQMAPACTATGDLEIIEFESKIFPTARKLRILLPQGYRLSENRGQRYPVLYLNDGQNKWYNSTGKVLRPRGGIAPHRAFISCLASVCNGTRRRQS